MVFCHMVKTKKYMNIGQIGKTRVKRKYQKKKRLLKISKTASFNN